MDTDDGVAQSNKMEQQVGHSSRESYFLTHFIPHFGLSFLKHYKLILFENHLESFIDQTFLHDWVTVDYSNAPWATR